MSKANRMTRVDKMAKTKGMILLHMLGLLFLLLSLGGYLAWRLSGSLRFHNLTLIDAEEKEVALKELEVEAEDFYEAFLTCQEQACNFTETQPDRAWIELPFSFLFDAPYTHTLLTILAKAQKEKQWVKFTEGPKGYYYFALWVRYDTFLGLAYLVIPKELETSYLKEGRFYQLKYRDETSLITLNHNQQTQSFNIQSLLENNTKWQDKALLAQHYAEEGFYLLTREGGLWGVELEQFFLTQELTPFKVATVEPWLANDLFSEDTFSGKDDSGGNLSFNQDKEVYLLYKIGRDFSLVHIERLDTNNLKVSQVIYAPEGNLKKDWQQIFSGVKGVVAQDKNSSTLANDLPEPLLDHMTLFLRNSQDRLIAVATADDGAFSVGEVVNEALREDASLLGSSEKLKKSQNKPLKDIFKDKGPYFEYRGEPQFYYQIID